MFSVSKSLSKDWLSSDPIIEQLVAARSVESKSLSKDWLSSDHGKAAGYRRNEEMV